MEDDKKKRKKNKKKKNKQANEPTESDKLDAKELTSDSQSHVEEIEQNNNGELSDILDASNDSRGDITADVDGHLVNGYEVMHLAEAEKQQWLEREAILEGKIKELQAEKDAQIQKEAFLEERVEQLMKENDGNSEKEASQNGKIKELNDENNAYLHNEARLKERLTELENEKDALIQKEGTLEHQIQQLQKEMDSQLQKEISLKNEILELKGERDSWVPKEDGFEVKFNQVADEASLLNVKLNAANESIASLTIDNAKLKAQVVELEISKASLFNETRELREFISGLQLQISNLEMDKKISENGDANYEIEAAHALVERLMTENSELVVKVNELNAKLEHTAIKTEQFPSDGSVLDDNKAIADMASGASKKIAVSDSTQSLEDVMVKDETNGELVNVNSSPRAVNSSEPVEADEIVQIPLDELELKKTNEEADVSLTDSPLIGAPFRLISFVASYVSGADLVHKK